MIKCDESCSPCCDYCIHARRIWQPIEGKVVTGCRRYEDEEHQRTAVNLGYCEDFHCENAEVGEDEKDRG